MGCHWSPRVSRGGFGFFEQSAPAGPVLSPAVGDRFVRRHDAARTSTNNFDVHDISYDTDEINDDTSGYTWSASEVTVAEAAKYLCIFDIGQVELSGSTRAVGTLMPSINGTLQTRYRATHRYLRNSGGNHGASIGMCVLDLAASDDVKISNPDGTSADPTDRVGAYATNVDYGGALQLIRLPDIAATLVERTVDAAEVGESAINTTRPWVDSSGTWVKITYDTEVLDEASLYSGSGGDVVLAANKKYMIVWGATAYQTSGSRHTYVTALNVDGTRVQTGSGYARDATHQGPPMCGMYLHETGGSAETIYLEATREMETDGGDTPQISDAYMHVIELPASAEWIHADLGALDWDSALAGTSTWYTTPLTATPFRADGNSDLSVDNANDAIQNDSGGVVRALCIGWHRWDRDGSSSGTRKMPWTRWNNGGTAVGYGVAGAYSRGQQSTTDTWQAHYCSAALLDLANGADLSFQANEPASGSNADMGIYASTNRHFLGVQVLNLDTIAA